jgi:hypothetical protein
MLFNALLAGCSLLALAGQGPWLGLEPSASQFTYQFRPYSYG